MDRNYGGVIWTNHALDRLNDRGIKQGDAWATWRRPDQSKKANISGSWVYYRRWGHQTIEVVAKLNEKKEWVILSVWSRKNKHIHTVKSENKVVKWLKFLFR